MTRMKLIRKLLICALLCVNPWLVFAQGPEILKVDPPSWWVGSTVNPVRLLIHGKNFRGARVEAIGPGVNIGTTTINARGTYIFADVGIDNDAAPGKRALSITTPRGSARAEFEVLPPLNRAGRFQGFSPDDVMYLIMIPRTTIRHSRAESTIGKTSSTITAAIFRA